MSRIEVGYVWHERFLDHHVEGHPESATRLRAVMQRLRESGELERLRLLGASPATFDELCELHAPEHVTRVHSIAERGGGLLDDDTYLVRTSFEAASLAAGAAMRCAAAVMGGEVRRSMALVRPPGHHAFADHGEGFCLFNNAAFAARAATGGLSSGDAMWSPMARRSHAQRQPRAMIIDFDVHHGNGTQSIFEDDPSVLVLSLHQFGRIYPGTGGAEEVGHGAGRGFTINVPMPAGAGDALYARAFEEIVAPAARRFGPDALIVSAGFDGHWRDPLAQVQLTLNGYTRMLRLLRDLADELCDGRMICVLEGGYDREALAHGVLNMSRVLRGADDECDDPIGPPPRPDSVDGRWIDAVRRIHGLT
jgi:acetoin utilization deacetylase AcuC-like enzyme